VFVSSTVLCVRLATIVGNKVHIFIMLHFDTDNKTVYST